MSNRVFLSLGANMKGTYGAPHQTFKAIEKRLKREGISIQKRSSLWLTEPWPDPKLHFYINAVWQGETQLSPQALLSVLKMLEEQAGRQKTLPNASRPLDIDILDFNSATLNDDQLTFPHPRLSERRFVLEPLLEVAPNWQHPATGQKGKDLLKILTSQTPPPFAKRLNAMPEVMGVVNVTPDSFSDGGQFESTDRAIAHALRLLEEGADILDIGGESTRPGSMIIPPDEEQTRVLPVIEAIASECRTMMRDISIDSRNHETMQKALQAGATILNDVSAFTHDDRSVDVAREAACPVILMHMQGTPQTMQNNPYYKDVYKEIFTYFIEKTQKCVAAGIDPENVIIDLGIGFGKTPAHNIILLEHLEDFRRAFPRLLTGVSRKSIIEKLVYGTPPDDRLGGSIAFALHAARAGSDIIRVHDVKETLQALVCAATLS